MLQTSARLLHLLSLLQSRRFWQGGELAQELGITERSVRRDVEKLRELGYPIHAAAGVGGGYELGAGKELPPLPLDDEEAVAVAVGLRAAATGPVKGVEAASLRALTKLEQVLPKRLRRRVNALEAVSVRMGDHVPAVDAEALTTIAMACRDTAQLRFEYRSHEGDPSVRSVEPYRLVHTSFRWYLLAFDLAREAWRTFRVDRIEGRPRAGKPFTPRPLPAADVGAYVEKSVSAHAQRIRARVTIFAPAAAVSPRLSAHYGRVEPLGKDRCRVELNGESLDTLAFWLAFVGHEFEVHEPEELARHLRVLAKRLHRGAAQSAKRVAR